MVFILISSMTAFMIASGICYFNGYNGKGAIFLAIGVILLIGTYQYYESIYNKRKRDNSTGYIYDGCGFIDCCKPIHWPASGDCSSVDPFTHFDCSGTDCSMGDCKDG